MAVAEQFLADRSAALRVGDDERSAAVDSLQLHHAAGRLTFAEFDDRMSRALRARTATDLVVLFVDLPTTPAAPLACRRPARRPSASGVWCVLVCLAVLVVGSRVQYSRYEERVPQDCPNLVFCPVAPYDLWVAGWLTGSPPPD